MQREPQETGQMADYVIKQGDTLSEIAEKYNMTSRQLYEHSNNEAFRVKRPDPNRIYPGDVLWVPDKEQDSAVQTSQSGPTWDGSTVDADDDAFEETERFNPLIFHDSTELFPYKVQDGDSLKSIAESIGCTWQELAMLNWGTDEPKEINWYLGNYFVCTKKIGANYVFTSQDTPGILLLPRAVNPADVKLRRTLRASRYRRNEEGK